MNIKILFLLITCFFIFPSCGLSKEKLITRPPIHNFTKVFKEATVIKCFKKTKKCEEKKMYSTGSGLIIDLINGETTALSAGHVCSSEFQDAENDQVSIKFTETILVLDSSGSYHQAHVVLSEQKDTSKNTADLCLLFIPTIDNSQIKTRVSFSPRGPTIGEEVYYMGAPWGVYHPPTVPIFRGTYSGPVSRVSSMVTAPVAPGSSGGVVLNKRNMAVGVVYAVHPSMNQISMISNYYLTKDFLIRAKKLLTNKN